MDAVFTISPTNSSPYLHKNAQGQLLLLLVSLSPFRYRLLLDMQERCTIVLLLGFWPFGKMSLLPWRYSPAQVGLFLDRNGHRQVPLGQEIEEGFQVVFLLLQNLGYYNWRMPRALSYRL